MRPDDEGFWPDPPKAPQPQYCTPDDVALTLDLPDPNDAMGYFRFTDMSHPSYEQVCRMICANEDRIDQRVRRSWRVNQVRDYITDIPTYMADEVGFRSMYYANGGYPIHLRRNILPWDPQKGDRISLRKPMAQWGDISGRNLDERNDFPPEVNLSTDGFWIDYAKGTLYLRTRRLQPKYNAVCITYRYGSTEPAPPGIKRLCCLMTAIQVIQSQAFAIKYALGGDVAGIKDSLVKAYQEEINELFSMYQRSGTVHGVPKR